MNALVTATINDPGIGLALTGSETIISTANSKITGNLKTGSKIRIWFPGTGKESSPAQIDAYRIDII